MAWGHPTVWEGRKGGRSATKKQKRPDGAWPDQADRAERGGGGRVAETEREIKTERLIDRQKKREIERFALHRERHFIKVCLVDSI